MRIDPPFDGFTCELWRVADPIHAEILEHPFLTGLIDGSLATERFRASVIQSWHFTGGLGHALEKLAARCSSDREVAFFRATSSNCLTAQRNLLRVFTDEFGLTREALGQAVPPPATKAYLDFTLVHTAVQARDDGIAAILASFWLYREVASAMVSHGSPDPRYQRWIDTYASDDFIAAVDELLDLVDALGEQLDAERRARFVEIWLTGCRYEWMSWDSAWRQQEWPI